ncbi:MAG: ParB/RepB/Spo0J family partition protein [Phycisphaerae bacterium]|nr:ParB/RepB/Spo0J family partition protein [Phycisphaerae bacterium]
MAKTTNRLGKGLNALISARSSKLSAPTSPTTSTDAEPDPHQIQHLVLASISNNPRQPRTTFDNQSLSELADSIKANGILQPIIVRTTGDNTYELVAGERRVRAAKLAGLDTIPAMVHELSENKSFELALIENLQREDLAPLERASAYQQYLDSFGGTVEDLAQHLSESRANISNYLRLLKLQPEVCYLLGRGQLSMGQARAIAGITDQSKQLAIARLAFRRNLSVRQVEELARSAETSPQPSGAKKTTDTDSQKHHLDDVEQALAKALGLRVRLNPGRKKNSGRVIIWYSTLDEFDRIAERIGGDVNLE